jgi:hypothetical protein
MRATGISRYFDGEFGRLLICDCQLNHPAHKIYRLKQGPTLGAKFHLCESGMAIKSSSEINKTGDGQLETLIKKAWVDPSPADAVKEEQTTRGNLSL